MQETFDWLYQRSLHNSMYGIDLYKIITSENNILLAYRMIKSNVGSKTCGVDNITIDEYKMEHKEKFIQDIRNYLSNYIPYPVRRIEIPKHNGKTRPLGIPTMRDRLIQQMFKQVLEPICEAKFYKHSYGFRPNRSTTHALSRCLSLVNVGKCHYVVDVDIKGFFDNVNHNKLLHQLYEIGVKDRRVLSILAKMMRAPIHKQGVQNKGTPQGSIISPLLSNVVLNELDWWVANQWEYFKSRHKYHAPKEMFRTLRKTSQLKEMYIVRYADDFKIFTKDYKQAWKIFHAVKGYLENHLKLEISKDKSQVTNLRKRNSEFLGFEMKAVRKGKKYVINTHISRMKQKVIKEKLRRHLKTIQKHPNRKNAQAYNAYVLGIHQYYSVASHVFIDFSKIAYSLMFTAYNRLNKIAIRGKPREPPMLYSKLYSLSYKTYKINNVYLYPIMDVKWKMVFNFNQKINDYTLEGRIARHSNLKPVLNREIQTMIKQMSTHSSLEYVDNRLSKYSMQNGKCAVMGTLLLAHEVHCHHILPVSLGGTDKFNNLTVIHKYVHKLIHAKEEQTIEKYLRLLNLNGKQIEKLNKYRGKCNLAEIK
ncbi:group II intron reverse transcriptase/maturase [Vagococcus fluvialis]|nr:group II intron reverse transcriptase/maturase [Vagococcus fluvialis]